MIKYIFLGIIQGLTEFLPVSSSAHLVILQRVLGVNGEEVALSVVLHLGTLLALIIYFFKDIIEALRSIKTLSLIFIVTLITGVIGLAGKNFFESLFQSPKPVAFAMIITGVILLLTQRLMGERRRALASSDAFILGITQGISIIPGISRSGITISTLLFRKIDREIAFKFSFLASIPAILGAALLEIKKVDIALNGNFLNFSLGFITSLITGILSLRILKFVIHRAKFHYFGYYCFAIAIVTLIFVK